jgi:hypothetical protein
MECSAVWCELDLSIYLGVSVITVLLNNIVEVLMGGVAPPDRESLALAQVGSEQCQECSGPLVALFNM